jgi:ATP-dependent Lhr-like helicase
VIFPKFRGDLLACAAVTRAMRDGRVEATRYPRNPLDVLAQQIVAMVGVDTWTSTSSSRSCASAPFAELARGSSTACSTCCPAAIRRTNSPSCVRA